MRENNKAYQTLGEFLLSEIQRRGMSHRQFAEFVGVSSTIINKLVDYDGSKASGYPSVAVLVKIAKATHIDLATLMSLVEPSIETMTPRARLLAQWIDQLPPDKQEIIDSFLLGAMLKEQRKTDE